MKTRCRTILRQACILLFVLRGLSFAEPIALKRVVELALTHATGGAIAAAEEQRIAAAYHDLRNNYIPQVMTGAGLGWSYGFPLGLEGSAPSLFNINAQSAVLNPSLRQFIKAAKVDSHVASLNSKDERNQIIQDAAQSYAELAKWEQRLARLQETEAETGKMEAAVNDRVKEGIDSEIDQTKARLSTARVRLRIAEAQGAADVLREHLAKLTGLAAAAIQTEPESIPAPPALPKENPDNTAASNPSVQAALEHARAQYLRAKGEHRALWPSLDFAAQYALLSKFNNFQNYYIPSHPCVTPLGEFLCVSNSFQQNNATVGVSIRFPLFNASQRSKADLAEADARKASKQAEAAKNQLSEETLRLQRSVAQLQAARDVAQLEYEIADKNMAAVHTRMDQGTATLHDLDDARTQLSERFISLQDVNFELQRAQLGLMRSTGELEKWALGTQ
ncbi:MAG: TolC family protein [Candidatus Sulfotelmatobacter sp.]|jgi:outer membrane protein TolC